MAELTIRWTKKRDGTFTMQCLRANGTGTWSRSRPGDFFFAHHDLSHYAIETTLNLKRAFWGLVAEGWELEDFGTPWPRGPIPTEAVSDATLTETCAGMMDLARATGERPDATQLNASISDYYANNGMKHSRRISQDELNTIWKTYSQLAQQWDTLPLGESMELCFPATRR